MYRCVQHKCAPMGWCYGIGLTLLDLSYLWQAVGKRWLRKGYYKSQTLNFNLGHQVGNLVHQIRLWIIKSKYEEAISYMFILFLKVRIANSTYKNYTGYINSFSTTFRPCHSYHMCKGRDIENTLNWLCFESTKCYFVHARYDI